MGHSYKLFVIALRPIVLLIAGFLVAKLGQSFFKKMINGVAIFLTLFALTAGGMAIYMTRNLLDPYYFATQDEVQLAIVAAVMAILVMMIAVGYFIIGNGKPSKWSEHYIDLGFRLLPVLAFMGFSIPLCIMEEVAGRIVGGLIEFIAFIVGVIIVRNYIKKIKNEEK